jgi:hypothetical protein
VAKVRRSGDGAKVTLVDHEVEVLSQLLVGLDQVLRSELPDVSAGSDPPADSVDPLVALTGLDVGSIDDVAVPADPAVHRLVPDAYEDPTSAAEFRRFTEDSLLAGKRESLEAVRAGVESVSPGGGKLALSASELDLWVRTLTDLRLVLGVRLGVVQASDIDELDSAAEDDPRRGSYEVFGWLGYLLDELLGALL